MSYRESSARGAEDDDGGGAVEGIGQQLVQGGTPDLAVGKGRGWWALKGSPGDGQGLGHREGLLGCSGQG